MSAEERIKQLETEVLELARSAEKQSSALAKESQERANAVWETERDLLKVFMIRCDRMERDLCRTRLGLIILATGTLVSAGMRISGW